MYKHLIVVVVIAFFTSACESGLMVDNAPVDKEPVKKQPAGRGAEPKPQPAPIPAPDLTADPKPGPVPDSQPIPQPDANPGPGFVNGIHDLGVLPAFLDDLQWPAAPITTRTVEVSNDWQLRAALRSGTRIVIRPGRYNTSIQLRSHHRDIDFVVDRDAVFTRGDFQFGNADGTKQPRRIRWTGGKFNTTGFGWHYLNGIDVLINNVNIRSRRPAFYFPAGAKRLTIINSTANASEGFCIMGGGLGENLSDVIVANLHCSVSDGNNPHRYGPHRMNGGINRYVVVDSLFHRNLDKHESFRMHHDNRNVYVARNIIISAGVSAKRTHDGIRIDYPGSSNPDGGNFDTALIEDNEFYLATVNNHVNIGGNHRARHFKLRNFEVRNNTHYNPNCAVDCGGMRANNLSEPHIWTNNIVIGPGHANWQGLPDLSRYGADH